MLHRENNCILFWLLALIALSADADDMLLATATFQSRLGNGEPVQSHPRRYVRGEWVKVGGFANSTYFYGQVQLLGKRKVAGYLYAPVPPPKREPVDPSAPPFPRQKQEPVRQAQIYVYGKLIRPGEFRVFDQQGTLYRLQVVENQR